MIATVVTRGFGNGTLAGTVPLVVTRGYAVGAATAPPRRLVLTLPVCRRLVFTLPLCRRREFVLPVCRRREF